MNNSSINKPLVSVIMSIYNAEEYVEEAINSITHQDYPNLEIILVDDCSSDSSLYIAKEIASKDKRITILRNAKNSGIAQSLNKGILSCHGKYVARMDADDWSFPYRISKQVSFMENNSNVVICGGSIDITNCDMNHLNYRHYPLTDKKIRSSMFRYSPFAHPCVIYRRDVVKKVGLYNENFLLAQDYDLYFRLGKVGELANLSDLLLKLRTHKKSSSQSHLRKQELVTILVRFKAWVIYDYPLRFVDLFYTVAQFFGVYLIPSSFKFKLFNFLRSSKRSVN